MNITNILSKIQVEDDSKPPTFHMMTDEIVVKIVCGPLHTAVLTNKNRLFTCGFGEKYSLGNGRNKTTNDFS
jgi:alpha-tubulin suppressor-like RCC1 family protein